LFHNFRYFSALLSKMNKFLTLFLVIVSFPAWAQSDSTATGGAKTQPYMPHTTVVTLSFGFIDQYRLSYSLPGGFEKNNFTGFPALYGKIEYGIGKKVSLAASLSYDGFRYNYFQLYTGYAGTIKRYLTDNQGIFGIGIIGYYHLGDVIRVKHLDPFVGVGVSVYSVRHTALPKGDSTIITTDHMAEPYLKVGARYYVSRQFSIFGDAGYDHQSLFSLGFSCRFSGNKK
jgi:hypothetical protein